MDRFGTLIDQFGVLIDQIELPSMSRAAGSPMSNKSAYRHSWFYAQKEKERDVLTVRYWATMAWFSGKAISVTMGCTSMLIGEEV
jgi:hypothetical protein